MASHTANDPSYRRDLGDGLVVRWSTPDDVERIAQLYSMVFRNKADAPPNTRIMAWTRDMMSGRHPLIGPGDFAVVEDTRHATIVTSTCLIRMLCAYDGMPFGFGRPEIVACDPDYRNRGLVRAVFDLIHARSEAEGHLAQGITGIPYFYRQFGYEYALDLGGSRGVPFALVPKLKEGEAEPYLLRPATPGELPQAQALYDRERAGSLVSTQVDEAYWRWVAEGQSAESGEGWLTMMILKAGDERPIGSVLVRRARWNAITVVSVAAEPGVPLVSIAASLLRQLQTLAEQIPPWGPDTPPADRINFMLGRAHPLYEVLGEALAPIKDTPYAWYIRVPDLPAFLRYIAPVLEQRLAESPGAGYTGELRLDFYRGGLRIALEAGRLTAVEHWRAPVWGDRAQAGFPPLVFLQLLFGHRSIDELCAIYPDVWVNNETRPLFDALFPKRLSRLIPLD